MDRKEGSRKIWELFYQWISLQDLRELVINKCRQITPETLRNARIWRLLQTLEELWSDVVLEHSCYLKFVGWNSPPLKSSSEEVEYL